MKVVSGYDDFSPMNNQFGFLEQLREHYPNFKVTMFTVPMSVQGGNIEWLTKSDYKNWVKAVKEAEDWLELAVHGLSHAPMEFAEITKEWAKKRLLVAERTFTEAGLKFQKIFKAPYWALSEEGREALKEMGYTIMDDGYYNWNLAEEQPEGNFMIMHGHVQNVMGNGLEETLHKVMSLPPDSKFYFLSEVLDKNGNIREPR